MNKKYKVFRDPIYGLISFDKEREKPLLKLIDTPEFQRLKRIRQLGFCHYTYPSAVHCRFSHSIGVSHMTGLILNKLNFQDQVVFSDEEGEHTLTKNDFILVMKIAALLHDIGHGPFSHVFEKVSNIKHSKLSARIIQNKDTQVNRILTNINIQSLKGNIIRWIVDLINGTFAVYGLKWAGDIISSQFDADRIDYLLRDSYMCGVKYAKFDWEWIINNMEIAGIPNENKPGKIDQCLVINASKGIYSLESFLISRYHMYEQVYYHKTTNGIDVLANKLFKRIKELISNDKTDMLSEYNEYLIRFLKDNSDLKSFLKLDDFYMMTYINIWAEKCTDEILNTICNCFIKRNFYKMIKQSEGDGGFKVAEMKKLQSVIGDLTDKSSDYYILESNYANNPYSDSYLLERREAIFVIDINGKIMELSDVSDIVKGLRNNIRKVNRTYLSPKYAQKYLNS